MGFATQAQVHALRLPAGKTDVYFWDDRCTGLSVRLQGGARTWVVWYQANGKRHRMKLGDVAGLKLAEARHEATKIVNRAKDGQDALKNRAAARAKAADTLKALIDIYLERRAKPRQRPRSYAETERYLMKRWAPLHGEPVATITRLDITKQLERIRTENGPIAANRARVYLGGCFSWAMRQGLVERNPIIGTEAPAEETTRDRVLKPDELAEVWRAAGDDDFGRIVKLLMLTGQRREEVAGMAWSELDLDRALWVLPAARTKNRREHEVPLPPQVVALLPDKHGHRALVFGRGKKAFSGFSKAKARFDETIARRRAERRLGRPLKKNEQPETKDRLEAWRLHDLRHSLVTHMADREELGIDPHIIEAVVNHVSGHKAGVAGRYNKATYREQKKIALQRWADWLQSVVERRESASNVVAFR